MRMLALGLLLAMLSACAGGADKPGVGSRATPNRPRSCAALLDSLVRLPAPTTMRAQRLALGRLAQTRATLARRFSVRAGAAVRELSASLRAEHESISARRDGRVTASRRLHADATARYARGRALVRASASACP
jgi:hypothetical protein